MACHGNKYMKRMKEKKQKKKTTTQYRKTYKQKCKVNYKMYFVIVTL
jgi:hypothetical protein